MFSGLPFQAHNLFRKLIHVIVQLRYHFLEEAFPLLLCPAPTCAVALSPCIAILGWMHIPPLEFESLKAKHGFYLALYPQLLVQRLTIACDQ